MHLGVEAQSSPEMQQALSQTLRVAVDAPQHSGINAPLDYSSERLLTPGEVVKATIPLTYVGHRIPAGSHLRLLVSGSNFPWADPNPHTGEPVATAVEMRSAVQTIFHDSARLSRLILPVLP